MDGIPDEPAGSVPGAQGRGARDAVALLLEIRNEQRLLRCTLEALVHALGLPAAGPRPGTPPDGPAEVRRQARGLALIQRALARRQQDAGEARPSHRRNS